MLNWIGAHIVWGSFGRLDCKPGMNMCRDKFRLGLLDRLSFWPKAPQYLNDPKSRNSVEAKNNLWGMASDNPEPRATRPNQMSNQTPSKPHPSQYESHSILKQPAASWLEKRV